MFVANLIESKEPVKTEKKGFFGLFSSKTPPPTSTNAQRQVLIDGNLIRIINDRGSIDEEIKLSAADQIIMRDSYNVPRDLLQDKYPELKDGSVNNYLRTHGNDYKFRIDSYAEVRELQKYILFWKSQGIKVIESAESM